MPDTSAKSRQAEERELLRRYHRLGDPAARDQLVARFMPLARQLARRYHRGAEPLDDLVQVASIGLIKAVDRFDPERTTAFSSFAVPTILGELRRHFRDRTWSVRVPRELQEMALKLDNTVEELTRLHGQSPTIAAIAERLGSSEEQVLEAMQASRARHSSSLDTPLSGEDEGDTVGSSIGVEEDGYDVAERRAVLDPLLAALAPQEREVVTLRFHQDLTQAEIAARIGCSQMQVSRLLRRAIERMQQLARVEA
jgi:RNA polymerase sigma-B factor